ncbi:hypothetical protein MAUB_64410 (plasmid) [Mycolicibacterium aubagnense]|uniref:FtsK domain-containing protein n=2 Tax=Mycolicibacterium aubagnense TaxID=319707 RepID=A0ABN5Z282_9MYCO|nr:type VII secretion protein EccCb [Mycolicibacterium aubagnense]BBX88240.1 hypothetical protein MAUB_64410 [Mycolicibacterium aubagnense]
MKMSLGDGYVIDVSRDALLARDQKAQGEFWVTPDLLSDAETRAIVRRLARYHADADRVTASAAPRLSSVDLGDLTGIKDFARLDLDKLWARTSLGPPQANSEGDYLWGEDWLRIPVGRDSNGNTFYIDLKETHEFSGGGFHVVVVGTTGSGKSEFLKTLVLGGCLTHSPQSLVVAVFDFKGSSLVHSLYGLPHLVAGQNNLRSDSMWMDRMADVLFGEFEIRKQALDRAGVGDIAEYEYLRIHKKEKLRPLPHMMLVVDEFTQMFGECEAAKEVIDEGLRQGRSLGIRVVLGSQQLGHVMSSGLLTNVPHRVALRTGGEGVSRAVIESDEADRLPKKPAGAGYHRIYGDKHLSRVQFAYTSGVYVKSSDVVRSEEVRTAAGYVVPQDFTVTPMGELSIPQPVEAVAAPVAAPQTVIGPDGREMKKIQVANQALRSAYTLPLPPPMWLPPLAPLQADDLVRRTRRRGKPWDVNYGEADADATELALPVGMEDRPFDHKQYVYAPDLTQGNLFVVGLSRSGKSTAIATMITAGALKYTPRRVQFYIVSMAGTDYEAVQGLPHVGGYAQDGDPETVRRIFAEMNALVAQRADSFKAHGLTLDRFRRRKFGSEPGSYPEDGYGDVFLVIDGWELFGSAERFEKLIDKDVVPLMTVGPAYGVHMVIAAGSYIRSGIRSTMWPRLTNFLEFKLDSTDTSRTTDNNKMAAKVPFGSRQEFLDDAERDTDDDDDSSSEDDVAPEPRMVTVRIAGRGISMNGYHFQAGEPKVAVGPHVVDLSEALPHIKAVAASYPPAPRVHLLPTRITLDEVIAQTTRPPSPPLVPLGISELDMKPVYADFKRNPHLLITGRPNCGLSSAVTSVAQSIMDVYSPQQAKFYVVDPLRSQLEVVEGEHLGEYVHQEDEARQVFYDLAEMLTARIPTEKLTQAQLREAHRSWSGPEIFVLVDRIEEVQQWDRGGFPMAGEIPKVNPLSFLAPLVTRADEVGLHFVIGRRLDTSFSNRVWQDPIVSKLMTAKSAIIMDGDPADGPVIEDVRAQKSVPGRGLYLTEAGTAALQFGLPRPVGGPR